MLTKAELKEYLNYDPDTGEFNWIKKKSNRTKLFIKIGYLELNGNLRIEFGGKKYLSHRLAWLYMTGEWPKYVIDHVNGNPSDNRWCNLRDVTHQINMHNRRKSQSNSKLKTIGVSFYKANDSYTAQIVVNKKKIHLGYFKDKSKAHQAYLNAKKIYHPSFVENPL